MIKIKVNDHVINAELLADTVKATPLDDRISIKKLSVKLEQVNTENDRLNLIVAVNAVTTREVHRYWDYDEYVAVYPKGDDLPVVQCDYYDKVRFSYTHDQLKELFETGNCRMWTSLHDWSSARLTALDSNQCFSNYHDASDTVVDSFNHNVGTADEPLTLAGFGSGPEFEFEFSI